MVVRSNQLSRIAIFGVGGIGFRYLEGLTRQPNDFDLQVFDKDANVIALAERKLKSLDYLHNPKNITFFTDINQSISKVDLAILATPSTKRYSLIEVIKSDLNPQFWILEKVLAQSISELKKIEQLLGKSNNSWVNTPRRLMNIHLFVKQMLEGRGPIVARKYGSSWGMACNAIHFIDLVCWLTGENVEGVDVSGLEDEWVIAKRKGFFEINGELVIRFTGGSILELSSDPVLENSCLEILSNAGQKFEVDESRGVFNEAGIMIFEGVLEFQSDLTFEVVSRILVEGTSYLPSVKESVSQHEKLIAALIKHWNVTSKKYTDEVPIT